MIVIKIKTYSDYKKEFLRWLREPRANTCKEYVSLVGDCAEREVIKSIREECGKNNVPFYVVEDIIHRANTAIDDACKRTIMLIDKNQPKV